MLALGKLDLRNLDDAIHDSGEGVASEDGEEVEGHDHRLHRFRRLGVGELEANDGDHDF